jgi:hypothetical protein
VNREKEKTEYPIEYIIYQIERYSLQYKDRFADIPYCEKVELAKRNLPTFTSPVIQPLACC